MPSQWRMKRTDVDNNTVPFTRLAELIRAGQLSWEDEVQQIGTTEWIKLENVIGLRRLVENTSTAADELLDYVSQDGSEPTSGTVGRRPPARLRTNRPLLLCAAALLCSIPVFVVWIVQQQRTRWLRFPPRQELPIAERDFWFPLLGRVTCIEFTFLVVDVCVVLAVAAVFLRRRST
jgi:hypothetical protein